MIFPQVLKITEGPLGDPKDAAMSFYGESVLDDGSQVELGLDTPAVSLTVDIDFWDLTLNAVVATIAAQVMTFREDTNIWTLPLNAAMTSALIDRHKYVGRVTANIVEVFDMRPFRISEFTVDNLSFEQMLARLPYEISLGPSTEMRWYASTADFGGAGPVLFHAKLYEGGVGTSTATSASSVTHRGPIVEGP